MAVIEGPVLVTGGAGFIGSALVRCLVRLGLQRVVNLDKLTYAGNLESLSLVEDSLRYEFVHGDICDSSTIRAVLARVRPQAVFHLAAESHVDRSIDGPDAFVRTNVAGTATLLQECLVHWRSLAGDERDSFRFVHVSTDEVYGSLGTEGLFTESTPYAPNSPYSASKAASDHFVRSWHHTYGFPAVTTNCSNNYGPYQFPEKLIPLMVLNASEGKSLPIYGTGDNVRDWLYVDDHVNALWQVANRGRLGETYNIGGRNDVTNLDVVRSICTILDELCPNSEWLPHESLITFVTDRPGHDQRYAIDASKVRGELGWVPHESLASGLRKTVQWYLDYPEWCRRVQDGSYCRERLGAGSP